MEHFEYRPDHAWGKASLPALLAQTTRTAGGAGPTDDRRSGWTSGFPMVGGVTGTLDACLSRLSDELAEALRR